MKKNIFFYLFLGFFLLACSTERKENTTTDLGELQLPDDFITFYQQFHQDSSFQLSRITFPLEGIPPNAFENGNPSADFRWQREEWQLHQPMNSQTFKRNFRLLNDDLIEERIIDEQTKFGLLRRFARLSDGWNLVYYAGMNRLVTPKN